MKREARKAHLLRARIGVITHQVFLFIDEVPAQWLTVACEQASLTVPPRHYPVPKWAKLTRHDVDCMACIALGAVS